MTQTLVEAVQRAGPARFLNWSPGMSRRTLRMRFMRNMRVLQSIAKLVANGRVADGRLYLVANGRSGLYITALLVLIGRSLGYTIYLHHHVYSYIDNYDWRMAWIDRLVAGHGAHVVHAEKMSDDFRRLYKSQSRFIHVVPSIVAMPPGKERSESARPFRLGHLSNLTIEKGLDVVIETFARLVATGCNVHLDLAGPVARGPAQRMLDQALADYAGSIRYLGPLYGEAKTRFYSDIDAFLFPTRSESWGIVLEEAMTAGVPAITYGRGCTPDVVGEQAGLVIDKEADFAAIAATQVQRWIDHEDEYRRASQAAIEQAAFLHREGERTLAGFVEQVFSTASQETE